MREKQSDEVWLAAHLYYTPPWESFLAKVLAPFARDVLARGLAKNFFFIRYSERGFHIRLRFRGEEQKIEQLKPELEAHFGEYMSANPSKREAEQQEQKLLPNNSVQFITYEPELVRYGGPLGLGIAENLFEASSQACLEAFGSGDDWHYDQGLGSAVTMHLTFAYGMGFSLEELSSFCQKISQVWVSRTYQYDAQTTQEEHRAKAASTQETFAEMFSLQKEALVGYSKVLWEALEEEASFEQDWLNQWGEAVATSGQALKQALRAGDLEIPDRDKALWVDDDAPQWHQLWPILESYVHMTNNRLGILNQDEAYLGYLIRETIPFLGGEEKANAELDPKALERGD